MTQFRLMLLFIACACGSTVAQTTQPVREIQLLAMGDWGSGDKNQRAMAEALAQYASSQSMHITAMLTAGDNFYNHMTGIDDPEWKKRFEDMYDPVRLNIPFYATLGNHDYEKDEWKAQLAYPKANPQSRFKLPNQWYRLDLPADNPLVTILMLDSNKSLMGEEKWAEQKGWLTEQLSAPRKTKWTIAVAHHPLYSNGAHGDNGVLQREWSKLFAEHGLDMYICGHDHDLQHLEIKDYPVSLVLCGGGGANIRKMVVDQRGPFSKTSYGFAHLTISEDVLLVKLLDQQLNILHEFTRDHEKTVRIVSSTPSDAGIPRTVGSVTRGDDGKRGSATTQSK